MGRHAKPMRTTGPALAVATRALPATMAVATIAMPAAHSTLAPAGEPTTMLAPDTLAANVIATQRAATPVPQTSFVHAALNAFLRAQSPPEHDTTYTVQPGDTLYGIAAMFYNDADWAKIYDANLATIGSPGLIFPGQKLVIPGASSQAAPAPASTAAVAASSAASPANTDVIVNGAWSVFDQPNGHMLAAGFAEALLRAIGAPVTAGNVRVIYDWQVSEGGGGLNNPLNGGDFDGLATSGQQFGGGANNYPSLAVNVRAMAFGLLNNDQYGYGAIVAALRANIPATAVQAIINSQWAASHYYWGAGFSNAPVPDGVPVSI